MVQRLVSSLLGLVMAGALLFTQPPASAMAVETQRLAGPTREGTAAMVALHAFPQGASRVYLAHRDLGLAVALAAGSLTDGPVLLVGDTVPEVVRQAVAGLDAAEIVALGNEVPDGVLAELGAARATSRLAGDGDIATAAMIALNAFPDGARTVYLAAADRLVDGLAGGALTAGPILLVTADVAPEVHEAVSLLDPDQVVALGGSVAIADDVLASAAGGRPTARLAGPTRFETAAAISAAAYQTAPTAYLVRSDIAPDAVVAGVLTDGPILPVPGCRGTTPLPVPDAIRAELDRLDHERVVAVGGKLALCEAALDAGALAADPYGQVEADRWGAVRFGHTIAQSQAAGADIRFDPDAQDFWYEHGCGYADVFHEGSFRGYVMVWDLDAGPTVMRYSGSVFAPQDGQPTSPLTVGGARVGMSQQQIETIGHDLGWQIEVTPSDYGGPADRNVWLRPAGAGQAHLAVRFEVSNEPHSPYPGVTRYHAGLQEAVQLIEGCV